MLEHLTTPDDADDITTGIYEALNETRAAVNRLSEDAQTSDDIGTEDDKSFNVRDVIRHNLDAGVLRMTPPPGQFVNQTTQPAPPMPPNPISPNTPFRR